MMVDLNEEINENQDQLIPIPQRYSKFSLFTMKLAGLVVLVFGAFLSFSFLTKFSYNLVELTSPEVLDYSYFKIAYMWIINFVTLALTWVIGTCTIILGVLILFISLYA